MGWCIPHSTNPGESIMSIVKDVAKVVTRTAIGGQVLSSIFFGRQHDVLEHSTIQELVDDAVAVPYQPRISTAGKQEPEPYDPEEDVDNIELAYVCIGIKGHRNTTDSNLVDISMPVEHKTTDTGLYQIVPFVIKPLSNDLTTEQRKRFRLRKVIEIDKVLYAAYYLRRLNTDNVPPTLVLNSVQEGEKTSTIWAPTINNLRPEQPQIGYRNDSSYITVVSNIELVFEQEDIEWFMEACELLFGHRHYSITELAYCTGVDKKVMREYPTVGVQTPSTTIAQRNIKEAQAVQVAYFINTDLNPSVLNKRFSYTVDLGINEPLFTHNS